MAFAQLWQQINIECVCWYTLVLFRMGAQHTYSVFVAMIVQWPHSYLYKNKVSSLVQILQLLASYHEVLESVFKVVTKCIIHPEYFFL